MITMLLLGEPELSSDTKFAQAQIAAMHGLKRVGAWIKETIISPFKDFMCHSQWWVILLFVIFFKFGDAMAGTMTNSFLIELGFGKMEIATIVKTYGFGATLLGLFIGGWMVLKHGLVTSLWVGGLLQMLSNLLFMAQAYYGYDTELLAVTIGVENLASGIGSSAFVAYLGSLCSRQYTATQYALLSSLAVVGRTWLASGSGFIVEETGWSEFFLITTLAAIPGLLLLKVVTLPKNSAQ
jgi:PAT family beta-lactamase induction signal transducer AmpG